MRAPKWDENEHPRDRKGQFIETGAEVRIWGGMLARVLRNVGNGRIEVEREDGNKVIVHRNYLTVQRSADGDAPITNEADAPVVPVVEASPDAVEDPALADGEGEVLPDRGDAPQRLVEAPPALGTPVGAYSVGEYVDGPSSIDGWVVGVTESGGPIVRTEDGTDWPLLPDAEMAREPENAPEAPDTLLAPERPRSRFARPDGSAPEPVVDESVVENSGPSDRNVARDMSTEELDSAVADLRRQINENPDDTALTLRRDAYSAELAERRTPANMDDDAIAAELAAIREPGHAQTSPRETELVAEQERRSGGARPETLDTVNPSEHGVFEDYEAGLAFRATAPLGENMQSLATSLGVDPDSEVTLYRGVPSSEAGAQIVPGDFVTTDERLARDYAGGGEVLTLTARHGDVLDEIGENSAEGEYIYRPGADAELGESPEAGPSTVLNRPRQIADNETLMLGKTEAELRTMAADGNLRQADRDVAQAELDRREQNQPNPSDASRSDADLANDLVEAQRALAAAIQANEQNGALAARRDEIEAEQRRRSQAPEATAPREISSDTPDPSGMSDAELREEYDRLDLPVSIFDEESAGLAEADMSGMRADTPEIAEMRARRTVVGAEIDRRLVDARETRTATDNETLLPDPTRETGLPGDVDALREHLRTGTFTGSAPEARERMASARNLLLSDGGTLFATRHPREEWQISSTVEALSLGPVGSLPANMSAADAAEFMRRLEATDVTFTRDGIRGYGGDRPLSEVLASVRVDFDDERGLSSLFTRERDQNRAVAERNEAAIREANLDPTRTQVGFATNSSGNTLSQFTVARDDVRPGDILLTSAGPRDNWLASPGPKSAPSGGVIFDLTASTPRTVDRVDGDQIIFTDGTSVSFRTGRDGDRVVVAPGLPERDDSATGSGSRVVSKPAPKMTTAKAAVSYIAAEAGVADDPEMVSAIRAALNARITAIDGMYAYDGWERLKSNPRAMALTQAAHGGIVRDPSTNRRKWDGEVARENLDRLNSGDPTLPTVALVGQRVALNVLDMDAPLRLGQPAASKRVEGVVTDVKPDYTWSQRVLIVDDSGEYHTDVFPSGGSVPRASDPDDPVDHPARAIASADPAPLRSRYMRNPESLSGNAARGHDFGQDVEPAGRYINLAEGDYEIQQATQRGWQTGEVEFQRPLHMDFGGGYSEEDNWKRRLSAHYGGLKGEALADAVRADGYDAIITSDNYGTSEVVDLTNGDADVTPDLPDGVDRAGLTGGAPDAPSFPDPDGPMTYQTLRGVGIGAENVGQRVRLWRTRTDFIEGTLGRSDGGAFNILPDGASQPESIGGGATRAYLRAEIIAPAAAGGVDRGPDPTPIVGPDGEVDLASLITPMPDFNADPSSLNDAALALAIRGIDDNVVSLDGEQRRSALIYRARLVREQQARARAPQPTPEGDPAEVATTAVAMGDLREGDRIVLDDGSLVTFVGLEDDEDGFTYRDADGALGVYYTDGSATFARVESDAVTPTPPQPEQNPEADAQREQQVRGGDLAPGDLLWLGQDKVEVLDVVERDGDTVSVTIRRADRSMETFPFGRDAVLDRADDQFLPDPSPLDSDVPTSRPVLYTYQRRNIVALGLDADGDPMVAEAARRIRKRQPLAAAHSAALANRLAEMANAPGVKPQRQRMLLRLASANNAASIEAGGRGAEIPDMPNADRVTKGTPADAGLGDQIAFLGLNGRLVQGKVSESRSMMSGRLTEVTVELPDGTTEKHMLTRRSDVYVLPDLPEPTVVPQPTDNLPEAVEITRLRVGDRVYVSSPGHLVEADQGRTEMTVVEVGGNLEENTSAYVVFDVRSPYSDEPGQRFVMTVEPGRPADEVIRVGRGSESADQPRDRNLPPMTPEHNVDADDLSVGDWVDWKVNAITRSAQGIIDQIVPVVDDNGNRIGAKYHIRNISGGATWHTVMDGLDNFRSATRIMKSDQNTVTRLEEQKRERQRNMRAMAVASEIGIHLSRYTTVIEFNVGSNALYGGSVDDVHYEDIINAAFGDFETVAGASKTTSMDIIKARVSKELVKPLQVHLSGKTEGPEFEAARMAANDLAHQIVADHHERIHQALLNVRPTEPGQTRAAAGVHLARMISADTSDVEQRDLMAVARGIVAAREAREAGAGSTSLAQPASPSVPEGGALSERIKAYKGMLPQQFGQVEAEVSTFGRLDLGALERGEVPEIVRTRTGSKDRAADGGPGAEAMRQLEVLRAAGADINVEVQRRFEADNPDLVGAAVTLDQVEAAYKKYTEAGERADREYGIAKDEIARAMGYDDWNHVENALYTPSFRPAGKDADQVRHDHRNIRESVDDWTPLKEVKEERVALLEAYRTLRQQRAEMSTRIAAARAKAARDTIGDLRGVGGEELSYNQAGRRQHEGGSSPLRKGETLTAMRYAESNYPTEWLRRLKEKRPLSIGTTARGFFQSSVWIIRLSKDDNRNNESGWVPARGRVATHELGHAMETVIPGLSAAEEAFLWSRTSIGEPGSRTRTKRKRIDKSTSWLDEFKESYSGKDYADGTHYELFTTGMESLFAGSPYVDGDDDYQNWIMGVLALL